MIFLQTQWIAALVLMFLFLAMGKYEAQDGKSRNWGLIWALLSLCGSAITIQFLSADWKSVLLANLALYVAIGVVRVASSSDSRSR